MSANKPYIIGLTGGIATGKSTASRFLRDLEVVVIDADAISHKMMLPGGDAVEPVRATFGDEYINEDGSVNRRALGQLIFSDVTLRRQLEGIVHPLVQRLTLDLIRQAQELGEKIVVLDVPLLFESGMDVLCDETWVITLSPEKQLKRLMERDNCTQSAALERINAQMPQEEKVQRATEVIDNERTEEKFLSELKSLYNSVRRRIERENA